MDCNDGRYLEHQDSHPNQKFMESRPFHLLTIQVQSHYTRTHDKDGQNSKRIDRFMTTSYLELLKHEWVNKKMVTDDYKSWACKCAQATDETDPPNGFLIRFEKDQPIDTPQTEEDDTC